jgi:hypothetical protein
MEAELSSVGMAEHNVNAVVRRFITKCPDCGPVFHDRVGHHGTISKKELSKLFPKRHRRQLLDSLLGEERKTFVRTLSGTRFPKDGEVEGWLAVQKRVTDSKKT